VNLVVPVREYLRGLVHASVRHDPLAAARHRNFIAPRLLGGLVALAVLPLYLAVRGSPGPLELVIFGWLIVPIAIAYFLSYSARYEAAHLLSALALTGLVGVLALMSGGISSPAAAWLVLVPLEAALCTSRRIVLIAVGMALAGAGILLVAGDAGASGAAVGPGLLIGGLSVGAAIGYAGLLALGAEAAARGNAQRLDAEEQRYRLLALNMADVISRHGRHGATLFISPAAEAMFGASVGEMAGHGLFDRVHVADRPAYLSALADAAIAGQERSVEFRVRRNGAVGDSREAPHFIWVEMRCQPFGPELGASGCGNGREVVAVMRDVTKRKEQEQAIEEARSEAERANAAKSRFLATMSHELRTPLNAVIGFSEMLMNENAMQLDAARRLEYAGLIHDSGQHLLSVVNLVLDMSKIESGNFVITPEPFAPAPVIRNCCDLLGLKAREAGLDIVVRLPADLPEVVADKRALKQMLLNLLSNALKFTAGGGRITVSAALVGPYFDIAVEDTGVGIAAEDLRQIGNPFFQVRGAYDRPYEGTGLGLSIVKGLAGLHGGQLQIESKPGVGTRMTIRLPLDCEKIVPAASGDIVSLNPESKQDVAADAFATAAYSHTQVKKRA
jgi:cell cycle sensor histidine kinase DivJ